MILLAAVLAVFTGQPAKPTFEELKAQTRAFVAAVDAAKGPKPVPVNGKVIGAYKVDVYVDDMSDEKTVEIIAKPTKPTKRDVHLSFSCDPEIRGKQKIQFLYNFDQRLLTTGGDYEIRMRVDQNKMIEYKATPSREHRGAYVEFYALDLFASETEGTLYEQLLLGKTFKVEVTSRNGELVEHSFPLRGFALASRTLPCVE